MVYRLRVTAAYLCSIIAFYSC